MNEENQRPDNNNNQASPHLNNSNIELISALHLYTSVIYTYLCIKTNSSVELSIFFNEMMAKMNYMFTGALKDLEEEISEKVCKFTSPIYTKKKNKSVPLLNIEFEIQSNSKHAITINDDENNLIFNITYKGKKNKGKKIMITLIVNEKIWFSMDIKYTATPSKVYTIHKLNKKGIQDIIMILAPIIALDPSMLRAIYDSADT